MRIDDYRLRKTVRDRNSTAKKINVQIWEEIKPNTSLHSSLSTIRQMQKCGVSPIVRDGDKIYMVFDHDEN